MSLPYLEVRVPWVPHVPPQGAQMRKLAVNQMTWCHPSSDLLYTVFVFSGMGEFETGLCIWNHITISTVHHVIPYKCKALLSRSIIVVRIFNFAVADVAQHADSTGQARKRRKSNEERESSTTGTNCSTGGIICHIRVFVEWLSFEKRCSPANRSFDWCSMRPMIDIFYRTFLVIVIVVPFKANTASLTCKTFFTNAKCYYIHSTS